jgi:hypothetical protein
VPISPADIGRQAWDARRVQVEWFAAKCLFQHLDLTRQEGMPCYEERVVLLRAIDLEGAVRRAEGEARRYASDPSIEFLEFTSVYPLFGAAPEDEVVVFSAFRSLPVEADRFVSDHYEDGALDMAGGATSAESTAISRG